METNRGLSITSRLLAAGLLALAIVDLPYGYFIFLRWVVTAVAVFHVAIAYPERKTFSVLYFAVIAIAFNPIVPLHLDRQTWQPIDLIASALLLLSFLVLRIPKSNATARFSGRQTSKIATDSHRRSNYSPDKTNSQNEQPTDVNSDQS